MDLLGAQEALQEFVELGLIRAEYSEAFRDSHTISYSIS